MVPALGTLQSGPLPVAGHGPAFVDPDFEPRLIESTRPIAEHYLAMALHHVFDTGVYDELARRPGPVQVATVAEALSMDEHRLRGLLLYLANEGVVIVDDDAAALTAKGRQYGQFRAWYTLMIGGYATTVQHMGEALRVGAAACPADGRNVGLGSCEMSRFDGMPVTRALLARNGIDSREMLDLGCGNALYLVEFCREMPGMDAWGAEPNRGAYDEAVRHVERTGMGDRIRLDNRSATEFLRDPPEDCNPDLVVFGFVLHEVLGQEGEEGVVDLLRAVVGTFPDINVAVIEVVDEIRNPARMRHGLARNFWNPYYLLHYFTPQRLETQAFWERTFAAAGCEVVDLITTDPAVDSSGLELGFLLRGAAA